MKKVILVGLLLVSWLGAKSVEQVQSEWQQKFGATIQEALQKWYLNDEAQRLTPHCQQAGDKGACEKLFKLQINLCEKGEVAACVWIAETYRDGGEMIGVSPDLKKTQSYADKVCTMDATICGGMPLLFMDKDKKIALKYAEKACEMELFGCVIATQLYNDGSGDISKNPQKVKYYTDKLCKAGVDEACGK